MTSKSQNPLKIVIPILIAALFAWITFTQFPLEEIIPHFKSANYGWVLLGLSFGFLSHLSRAYRWQYLLEPLGYTIKLPNSVMAVFLAYGANYLIPRSGEVLRAAVATNYEDIPFEKGFGTIVAERIADLVVLLFIICVTLVLEFDFILNILTQNFNPTSILLYIILLLLAVAAVFYFLRTSKTKFAERIKKFVYGLIEGITSVFKMKNKWLFILHTIFIWLMYLLMFYVTSFALPELSNINIGVILIAFIAGSFSIAATNGGIFVYPLAILGAFSLFGLPKDASLAFGWIMWTSQTILLIILSLTSLVLLPIYNKQFSGINTPSEP